MLRDLEVVGGVSAKADIFIWLPFWSDDDTSENLTYKLNKNYTIEFDVKKLVFLTSAIHHIMPQFFGRKVLKKILKINSR